MSSIAGEGEAKAAAGEIAPTTKRNLGVAPRGGADIEAPGAVLGGDPPLADATGFGQWQAAHPAGRARAQTTLSDAATIGLMDRLESYFAADAAPPPADITRAFWGACDGGQQSSAEYLLDRGAELNWIPSWERVTPLDAAQRSGAEELVE